MLPAYASATERQGVTAGVGGVEQDLEDGEGAPEQRIVMDHNPAWWDTIAGNVDEVIYTPIKQDATRVAALHSYTCPCVVALQRLELPI